MLAVLPDRQLVDLTGRSPLFSELSTVDHLHSGISADYTSTVRMCECFTHLRFFQTDDVFYLNDEALEMSDSPRSLYDLCLETAVADYISTCKFCKKEFRLLPDHVLFDFYYKMYQEKRLCLLGLEFVDLDIFKRMLRIKHKRKELLKSFQSSMDHCSNVADQLVLNYSKYSSSTSDSIKDILDFGLKLGGFFSDGGWYNAAIDMLNAVEQLCISVEKKDVIILLRLLDCYYKRIYVECYYYIMQAEKTYKLAQVVIEKLQELNAVPNLAGLYANFSALFFQRSEYEEAYNWAQKALKMLGDQVPKRVMVDVLRQASKSCVVKRRFAQAGLLINEAMCLATNMFAEDQHPRFADTLMDYGFYLLNFDSIQESVKIYERALQIRKEVFEKNNILVAIGHEDLAYAQYVSEYSSGNFYSPRDNAERAMRIMEKLLPKEHLLLASAKRVKALILEEIALDMREASSQHAQTEILEESEKLHKAALALSHTFFGENNVQTAKHYGNLGRLYQTMMLYKEAEKMHLRAISIKERLLGPNDYEVGLSLGHLASLYNYHMKRYRDAEKLYLRSINISLNLFGESYSGLEYDYRGIINVYTELHDFDSMAYYSQLMRVWKSKRKTQRRIVCPSVPQQVSKIIAKFVELC